MAMSGGQSGSQGVGLSQLTLVWRRFIHWWGGELAACIPAGLRHSVSSQRLLVVAGSERAELYPAGQSSGRSAAWIALGGDPEGALALQGGVGTQPWRNGDPCRVVLDSHVVLHKVVTLPVEAERNLRGVLLASMERYTPLPVAEVYFDFFVSKRRPEVRKLEVALYLAPKARIDRLLERLRAVGLRPDSIDVQSAAGGTEASGAGVNLLPAGSYRSDRRWVLLNRALTATALLLLAAVLTLPVVQRRAEVQRLTEEVASQREAVQKAEQERARVQAGVDALQRLQRRKATSPTAVEVITELTRLIPDDGWAGQVEIHDDRVRLSGEAASASDLIRLLTASTLFSDPRFEAPLTQNPRTNRERFVLSLAIPTAPKVN